MIINANALHIPLKDATVQCCVTSPPYYGLRDYGIDDQIGLEPTPDEYVAKLVAVFREVKRVLKDDGVLWLNLGDSYYGGNGTTDGFHDKKDSKCARIDTSKRKFDGYKPKDLIGIPWAVAFALRQPYENVLIKDRVWRAWFAGIIDGEGCITSNEVTTSIDNGRAINPSYPIILQVRMSDRQALERIVEVSGISQVQQEHLSPSQVGTLQRPPSAWKTSGDNAMRLLAECYPYLTVKRMQALIAWNLQKLKVGVETRRGVPVPPENMEKRKLLYSIIRDLNQRREVDIPSWCKEPEIDIEPGWYLRSDCIWSKPNQMPESVKDRPTKAHEYVFLLTKSAKYYYDNEAIFEVATSYDGSKDTMFKGSEKYKDMDGAAHERWRRKNDGTNNGGNGTGFQDHSGYSNLENPYVRNKRTVWTINTQPFKGAHFAVMPEKLVEPCILAGSRPGDVILDPFAGSGTVGVVAQKLGRGFVGIELNPEYVKLAETRLMATPVCLFNQSILEEVS